ncbi:GTPase YlqF [Candidatus Mycoplasma haematolamae str. Purdue]|uniref:GTPase YlqF n=1 Tax=Mycoplasma haematolamae (strain Purdue) TaxID=1212765 RepID=I7CJE8_MYCHA|nr:GTPase [Candidatus Mycoplasma haematolamae]AFO51964.1 GTPase YlqF [Candidatus Mycoplasma haematolamae str. Purdue]
MPSLSLIVLLVDSRAPFLREIYIKEIRKRWSHKNILTIYTKEDLTDSKSLENCFNLFKPSSRHRIIKLLNQTISSLKLTPKESTNAVIVMGATNSGKSSFINLLVGSKKTKRSPEPGTTRGISRHKIPSTSLIIYDSPGLFPSQVNKSVRSLLQLLNFLPSTPDCREEFSEWGYNYLVRNYPKRLRQFLPEDIEELPIYPSFLELLATKYKLLEKKGELSIEKAEAKFIHIVRSGLLGKILWGCPPANLQT